VVSSGHSECARCAKWGPPCLVYAPSKISKFCLWLYFYYDYIPFSRQLGLVFHIILLLLICLNTLGFSTWRWKATLKMIKDKLNYCTIKGQGTMSKGKRPLTVNGLNLRISKSFILWSWILRPNILHSIKIYGAPNQNIGFKLSIEFSN